MIQGFSSLVGVALAVAALALAAACTDGADDAPNAPEPDLGVSVEWLGGDPNGTLPSEVTAIRIIVFANGDGSFEDTTISVENFMMREDGRPYASPQLLTDLPTRQPIRIVVEGLAGGVLAWLGHIGPLVLSPGERRFVDLKMYPLGEPLVVGGASIGDRVLHTATALPDGRVLVAGGFDTLEGGAECPAGTPAGSQCWSLTGSREAFLFDATTGAFHPVHNRMLQPRGGHTATLLPGGRVLLAGGAPRAILVMSAVEGDLFAPYFVPLLEAGEAGAHATFEVFLPNANAEEEDLDRDGDPARGGFTGAADVATAPGRLNQQRFLQAAAVVPGQPSRVLLVGGSGADGGESTWEVYDDQRPGGYGVYDNVRNQLTTARPMPGAVGLPVPEPGRIWIFGGVPAALGNDDLAEIWSPVGDGPNGSVTVATETPFPNATGDDETPRPEYALLRPTVVAVDGGESALVVGWLGPRCTPPDGPPVFATSADGSGTILCSNSPSRNFVVDGVMGFTTQQTLMAPRAFGAAAELADGSVVLTGGLANLQPRPQPFVERLTGDLEGGALEAAPGLPMLVTARAFHTSTALPQSGVLTAGGLTFTGAELTPALVSSPEVLYPGRSPLENQSGSVDPDPMEDGGTDAP